MALSPKEFLATLYLGDRACKAIVIDGWSSIVRVQVDCISRVRSPSGTWDYYAAEDVKDGFVVFTGVKAVELVNSGHVPNDSINGIDVLSDGPHGAVLQMSIDSVDEKGNHFDTLVRVSCESIHLEDPARPGVPITE